MSPRRLLLIAAVVVSFVAAHPRPSAGPPRLPIADVFSSSNPRQVETRHLSLDLTVDFTTNTLRGSATHTIVNHTGARQFIVDTSALDVDAVSVDGAPATWTFGTPTGYGTPLLIDIDPQASSVRIDYRTRASSPGLRWVPQVQTRDALMPQLWSLSEPDFARSWIPLQDTPSTRLTYDATIHVPAGELALMSASDNPIVTNDSGVYTFTMPHAIAPYLIALAVGDFRYHAFDYRTGVYAEPSILDETVYETSYLPSMLAAAERLLGPYPFERYDLVFPANFNGGMENPEINFLTPKTIINTHPSPVTPANLIAHEMSHSWFGDTLTCGDWNDLWLNEAFASYYANRVVEEMGFKSLADAMVVTDRKVIDFYLSTPPDPRLTVLHRTFVAGDQPLFNATPYYKGEMFLKTLETRMGRAAFDAFIARYERTYRDHWVDDVDFTSTLNGGADLQVDAWIYQPGMPSNVWTPPAN